MLSPLYFRDRALFARLAFLHDHGGQFSDGRRAATHARGGCSLSQLAGPGWLAGPADYHNQPFRSDAALRVVSPTLWEIPKRGGQGVAFFLHVEPGDGLYSTQCTTNNAAFLLSFVFLPPSLSSSHFDNPFCFHLLPIPLSAGFFPSPCAGCWPPSTTGGPKSWCCALPGRTRLTRQLSRAAFSQVRKVWRTTDSQNILLLKT